MPIPTNYLIDIDHNIIMDVEPTPAHRSLEVESTKLMVDRVEQDLGLKPERLIGDTAYGTAPMLEWMVKDKGIEPHVSVWEKPENNPSIGSIDRTLSGTGKQIVTTALAVSNYKSGEETLKRNALM